MERKKAIKHFYTLLVKDLNVINRYTNENDLKSQLEDLIAISNIDMIELELALEEIDFMNKKENSYLKDHVYEPINDLHHEIIRYKELIIAQYKLNEHSDDLDKFLNEMDEAMLEVVEEAKMREIGNRFYTFKENNVKNIFTYQILDDFEKYVNVDLIQMYNNTNAYGSYIWQDKDAGTRIDASVTKPFEMRVYYSLGKPFINTQVGSLESVLTSYFYNLNLNSADLTYSVSYKNCTSITDPTKGEICYQSKFNEYVNTSTHIDFIVHDPNASTTY